MWFFIFSCLIACTGKLVSSSCPPSLLAMNVSRVVVRFGDDFTVNCSSLSNQTQSMGWESSDGGTGAVPGVSYHLLTVNPVKQWDMSPKCYINLLNEEQCFKDLPVTVYKMPDSVSLSNHTRMGPVVEGQLYDLQCDIVNVAPVRNLSVNWYKGNKIFRTETFVNLNDRSPVSKSSVIQLTAHRADNGTRIWCEAQLNLLDTIQDLVTMKSKPHEVTVLYPPTFIDPANETLDLPARSPLILNCTATGNPVPVYSWHSPSIVQQTKKNQKETQSILNLSSQLPGTYNCTASNSQGTKTKYFTVVQLPRNHTTLAVLVGVFMSIGVLLFIAGLFLVTPQGTFSFSNGYLRGKLASSAPI